MERWLSTSRVLIGLSVVLLVAALNRQDDMLYRMFLFMATVSGLGYLLPWWSLRSLRVTPPSRTDTVLGEGQPLDLRLLVHTDSRWPAFMVDVVTEWRWAERRFETRHTLGMVRRGQTPEIVERLHLPCRGAYEIASIRLECGFPLGLMTARRELPRPEGEVLVLPRPAPLVWPRPWTLADDHHGERTTPRVGPSFEPGLLQPYEPGQPLNRVNWRASARAGELVIQQFEHQGLARLHLIVARPGTRDWGLADSAGEAAIRLAAGLVRHASQSQVALSAALPDAAGPSRDADLLLRDLSRMRGGEPDLARQFEQVSVRVGEQIAVVVPAGFPPPALLTLLDEQAWPATQVQVWIGTGLTPQAQSGVLERALRQAGWPAQVERGA